MEIHEYTLPCGCKVEIEVSYDWVDERTEIEDVTLISICEIHRERGGDYDS